MSAVVVQSAEGVTEEGQQVSEWVFMVVKDGNRLHWLGSLRPSLMLYHI